VAKSEDDITDEYAATLANNSATTCLWWTSGYKWRENELACGGLTNKDTMFRCTNAAHCALV